MILKQRNTQTGTGAWAADSSGISTELDKGALITRLDVTAEITPSATLGGANQPDGPFRIIQSIRIEGGGGSYVSVPVDDGCQGGNLLHLINREDGFGLGHGITAITAPQRTYQPVNFVIHPGSRPKDVRGFDNPFDLTAFIPSVSDTNLRVVITTSGNDVMDDIVTITSAVYRFTLHQVLGTEAEIEAEIARQGVQLPFQSDQRGGNAIKGMVPNWITEPVAHSAAAASYSAERDIPVGAFLKRIAILAQDATADRTLRAADEVTGIRVFLAYTGQEIIKVFADQIMGHQQSGSYMEADDAALDGGQYNPHGFYLVDLRPHVQTHPDYGLDLRGFGTGAVKLGRTITTYAAGDDSLIIYERLSPYGGRRAGAPTPQSVSV